MRVPGESTIKCEAKVLYFCSGLDEVIAELKRNIGRWRALSGEKNEGRFRSIYRQVNRTGPVYYLVTNYLQLSCGDSYVSMGRGKGDIVRVRKRKEVEVKGEFENIVNKN